VPLAAIPVPGGGDWSLGPLTVRAYALCVIAGVVVAILVARRRYRASGGRPSVILDVAAWAVPFGLLGALAHALLLDVRHDFDRHRALWHFATEAVAALGVPGAIAFGALGAWIACRRAGVPLGPVATAAAPGVAFGLAIGCLGHWWAQNFYGRPASWLLAERIAPAHRVPDYENFPTFQPVFLYQVAWDVAVGVALIWATRRFSLTGVRTFMLGAAAYALGGLWIESMRIGPQPHVFGIPYDVCGDLVILVVAVILLALTRPRRGPRARTPLAGDKAGHVISMLTGPVPSRIHLLVRDDGRAHGSWPLRPFFRARCLWRGVSR
jgi:prolipoprotein diacylglyceryltransferase